MTIMQLVNFCHHFLEEHEDHIVAVIRGGVSTADLTKSMCEEVSSICRQTSQQMSDEL
jgi:TLR4 regulator and MIR-interacting MSAP